MAFHPCVGSGYCCMKKPCPFAIEKHGMIKLMTEGRCPELVWDEVNDRYFCKLVTENPHAAAAMGVGEGCTSSMNSWRQDVKHRPEINYKRR